MNRSDEEHTLDVRCDNPCALGVPSPATWTTAVRCIGLSAKAAEAAKFAREDMALDAVDCVLLGRPKSSSLSEPTIARVPGALVNLLHEGAAQDFLLAAHVDGDRWFCHGGGPEEDSFNASGLCKKDIALEATQQSSRSSVQTSDLRTRASSSPET